MKNISQEEMNFISGGAYCYCSGPLVGNSVVEKIGVGSATDCSRACRESGYKWYGLSNFHEAPRGWHQT